MNKDSVYFNRKGSKTFNATLHEILGFSRASMIIDEWGKVEERYLGDFLRKRYPDIFAQCVARMKVLGDW